MAIEQFIENEVKSNDVVLFMKGTELFPQCGFSARVVQILTELGVPFKTANVLEDQGLREGLKLGKLSPAGRAPAREKIDQHGPALKRGQRYLASLDVRQGKGGCGEPRLARRVQPGAGARLQDRQPILDLREVAIDVDIKRRVLPEETATA